MNAPTQTFLVHLKPIWNFVDLIFCKKFFTQVKSYRIYAPIF